MKQKKKEPMPKVYVPSIAKVKTMLLEVFKETNPDDKDENCFRFRVAEKVDMQDLEMMMMYIKIVEKLIVEEYCEFLFGGEDL